MQEALEKMDYFRTIDISIMGLLRTIPLKKAKYIHLTKCHENKAAYAMLKPKILLRR